MEEFCIQVVLTTTFLPQEIFLSSGKYKHYYEFFIVQVKDIMQ